MKVLIVKHARFEREGNMQSWLHRNHAEIDYLNLFEPHHFPWPESYDLIILLGGPMSINDESGFPWLVAEKRFVKQAIDVQTPVLGICLGGQLIASALGAKVTDSPETEIGWHRVESLQGQEATFQFPKTMEIFNWHNETFDLPEGATPLIYSQACKNQGFQYGDTVIGLQCHPEVTADIIQEWIDEIGEQMVVGPFVQSRDEMFDQVESRIERAQQLIEQILDYLVKGYKE